MSESERRILENYDALSRAAASRFRDLARERIKSRGGFSAAFSGGSTPKGFLQSLSTPEFAGAVDWARVHLFQVDERPVPPDHTESNYGMIRQVFLDRVPNASANFHRMRAEGPDLDAAARDYEDELVRELRISGGGGPKLDIIFLGMGPDGHTASLFPQSPALEEAVRWVRPNYVAKLGLSRLTLTYPALNAAQEVIFLVSGEEKAAIVETVLCGARNPRQFPSQGIDPVEGKVFWYLDRAAAVRLRNAQGPAIG